MTTYPQGAFMNISKVELKPNLKEETHRTKDNIQSPSNSSLSLKPGGDKIPNSMNMSSGHFDVGAYQGLNNHSFSKLSNNIHSGTELSVPNGIGNVFNFFDLPKYGLVEQSTQTMLTGNDIEELQYLRTEFANFQEQFIKDYAKNNLHIIKKMFPESQRSKMNSPQGSPLVKNFINIKRKTENALNLRPKRNVSSSLFNMFSDRSSNLGQKLINVNGSPSTGFSNKNESSQLKVRQKKIKENKSAEEIGLISSRSVPEIPNFSLDSLESVKIHSKPSLDDINISEMINNIKNSATGTGAKKERATKPGRKVKLSLIFRKLKFFQIRKKVMFLLST